ncbi:MAG: tripartite tricarboxylate transporter substrate binding protein [Thermodesulfobacteriota bacterium]
MKTAAIAFIISGLFLTIDLSMAAESGYPRKPIEIIVGYAPGGGTDLGARMIAANSKKFLGQELVIFNKPGGAGRVAMTILSKAKPDGYTLGGSTDTSIIYSPHIEPVSYKPLEDFTFITRYGVLNTGISVLTESPFRTFKDLIEFARANPNKLTISTVGEGGGSQVILEALTHIERLKIQIIPFAGAVPAMTALLGGHVMAASAAGSAYAPHLKAKKVRLLALMGEERIEDCPEVPTLKELGYSTLIFQSWYVIVGPKNMEKAVVTKLEETFRRAMDSPDYIKLAKELEINADKPLSGDELRKALIRRNTNNENLFKTLGMGLKR